MTSRHWLYFAICFSMEAYIGIITGIVTGVVIGLTDIRNSRSGFLKSPNLNDTCLEAMRKVFTEVISSTNNLDRIDIGPEIGYSIVSRLRSSIPPSRDRQQNYLLEKDVNID